VILHGGAIFSESGTVLRKFDGGGMYFMLDEISTAGCLGLTAREAKNNIILI